MGRAAAGGAAPVARTVRLWLTPGGGRCAAAIAFVVSAAWMSGADRDHGEAGLVLALVVVEARLCAASGVPGVLRGPSSGVRATGEADAGGGGQGEDRDRREGRAGRRHAPARRRKAAGAGSASRASPTTPPSPVGSGQLPGAGRSEASAAAAATPTR